MKIAILNQRRLKMSGGWGAKNIISSSTIGAICYNDSSGVVMVVLAVVIAGDACDWGQFKKEKDGQVVRGLLLCVS